MTESSPIGRLDTTQSCLTGRIKTALV